MAAKPKIPSREELAKSNSGVDMEALGNFISLIQGLRNSGVKRREYDLVRPGEPRLRVDPPVYATRTTHKK